MFNFGPNWNINVLLKQLFFGFPKFPILMCICVCVKVQSETLVTADYQGTSWEDSDPSVFRLKIVKTLQGEYQLTNGYGSDRAPQVMRVRNPMNF